MQSKQELEDWYSEPDRWGYFDNHMDGVRLKQILRLLGFGKKRYSRAIDIGCGEGFVTRHLPADEIHGLDLADNALKRLPQNVTPVSAPKGKYDLVISTGTLYKQYDHEAIYKLVMESASQYILVGGIQDWLIDYDFKSKVEFTIFPYREFTQKLTLYNVEISA
jgi:trans-aconitate methyltransferase